MLTTVEHEYPLVPNRMPDGSIVWEERGKAEAVLRVLREYDPRYSLVRNNKRVHPVNGTRGCWEIWRVNENGTQGRVGTWWGDTLPHPQQIIADLFEHDTRRGYDPVKDVIEHNDRVDAAKRAEAREHFDEVHDKMHWAMKRTSFGSHMPGSRPIALGPNRAQRRAAARRAR